MCLKFMAVHGSKDQGRPLHRHPGISQLESILQVAAGHRPCVWYPPRPGESHRLKSAFTSVGLRDERCRVNDTTPTKTFTTGGISDSDEGTKLVDQ